MPQSEKVSQSENVTRPENVAAVLLAQNLERCPDKAAYLCGDDTLTHRALAAEAARFANLLRARGIGPGDRVALVLPDSLAYPKALLGALLLGGRARARERHAFAPGLRLHPGRLPGHGAHHLGGLPRSRGRARRAANRRGALLRV